MAPRFRNGGFAPATLTPRPSSPFAVHDPRAFERGYSPAAQGDQVPPEQIRRTLAERGTVPFQEALDQLTAHNLPPQLVQGSFLKQITQAGVPGAQLLIPKNTRRMSYLVSNFEGRNLMLFSHDKPMAVGDAGASVGILGAGIPIGGYYQESNGSVAINDIWEFCNDPSEDFVTNGGIWVLGYEGSISVAGNPR